jgi:hypothetical protein
MLQMQVRQEVEKIRGLDPPVVPMPMEITFMDMED